MKIAVRLVFFARSNGGTTTFEIERQLVHLQHPNV